jgi:CheY-like chemotaxis protein/pimeloyl-ACP methyl ester carboxylesterase
VAREDVVAGAPQKFEKMDDYLRGAVDPAEAVRSKRRQAIARSQGAQEVLKEKQLTAAANAKMQPVLQGAPQPPNAATEELYFATVLICDAEGSTEGEAARDALEKAGYFVDLEWDGRKVVQMLLYQGKQYDCLLLERSCALCDGFEVCEAVRQQEKERRSARQKRHAEEMRSQARLGSKHVNLEPFVALPIIAFTGDVTPDDLRAYMEVGMDGCVSKPLEVDALLATVRAAAPQHAKPLPDKLANAVSANPKKGAAIAQAPPKANKMGLLGTIDKGDGKSGQGSAVVAAQSLSLPSSFTAADGSVSGVLQLDSETCLPYTIIDFSMSPTGERPSTAERHAKPFFNLVVCHDFFDTLERMKIVLSPLAARYPGLQVLLWNYPGQAFTEWRSDQLLNNDYLASCLHELLSAIGASGTRQFDSDKPFHMMGFGNGANVSTFYASHYNNPALRSLIHCNGFAFVDPHLAGALHDCMNVFSCAPPSRPDLPVYFYSRFLFSPAYLASVSTPLALNLYTAVHNPITLEGRIQLCLGALSHVDLRPQLAEIDLPIITVHATQGALVKPVHSEVFVEHRRGGPEQAEAKTIFEALKNANKSVVVWVKSGHELFQEAREQVVTLVEQMVTGYHETHDVAYQSAVATDPHAPHPMVRQGKAGTALGQQTHGNLPLGAGASSAPGHGNFEDAFIDNVLGQVREAVKKQPGGDQGEDWGAFSQAMSERAGPAGQGLSGGMAGGGGGGMSADEILAIKQVSRESNKKKEDMSVPWQVKREREK